MGKFTDWVGERKGEICFEWRVRDKGPDKIERIESSVKIITTATYYHYAHMLTTPSLSLSLSLSLAHFWALHQIIIYAEKEMINYIHYWCSRPPKEYIGSQKTGKTRENGCFYLLPPVHNEVALLLVQQSHIYTHTLAYSYKDARLRDEVLFLLWELKKINDLGEQFVAKSGIKLLVNWHD